MSSIIAYSTFQKDLNTAQLDHHLLGMLVPMGFFEFLHELRYHLRFATYILLLEKVSKTIFFRLDYHSLPQLLLNNSERERGIPANLYWGSGAF